MLQAPHHARLLFLLTPLLAVSLFLGCAGPAKTDVSAQAPSRHLAIAQRLIRQGNFETALAHLNQALDLNPQDPEVHTSLGWLYVYTGNYTKAKEELDIVERALPGSAQAAYLRGAILSHLAQPQDAVKSYQIAVKLDPNNPQIYFDLATSLSDLTQYTAAIETLEDGIDKVPKTDKGTRTNFLFALCSNHYQMKAFDDATQACKMAIHTTPDPEEKTRINDFMQQMELVRQLDTPPSDEPAEVGH